MKKATKMINIVDKYKDREYMALANDGGIVLCDKSNGAFLILRSHNDLQNLKQLLDKIEIIELKKKPSEEG